MAAFLQADVETQATVVAALCDVVVMPVGRGRPKGGGGFNPDRIRINWR